MNFVSLVVFFFLYLIGVLRLHKKRRRSVGKWVMPQQVCCNNRKHSIRRSSVCSHVAKVLILFAFTLCTVTMTKMKMRHETSLTAEKWLQIHQFRPMRSLSNISMNEIIKNDVINMGNNRNLKQSDVVEPENVESENIKDVREFYPEISKRTSAKSVLQVQHLSVSTEKLQIERNSDIPTFNETEFDDFFPKVFAKTPLNPNFIFHNKLPKSGSSTMNNIFKVLKKKNKFNFLKVESGVTTFYDRRPLVDFLQTRIKPPYLLLKHHYWVNFTGYGMEQPTFINVIRDPIEWFTSRYYFTRYGWKRKPGCRTENCGMSKEEFAMDIDECVRKRHSQCVMPWMYIPFFCGATHECTEINNPEDKRKSFEIAMKRIVNDYFFVGVLEQFEDSLKALEVLLPRYFEGAVDTWKGKFVQKMQQLTQTTYKKSMSEDSRKFFQEGPLKYEIKLYRFARKLLNKKLKYLGIESTGGLDESKEFI